MFIDKCLAFYTARLMRSYLTFEKYSSGSPPKPDKDRKFLLYIHIPFCEQLCPYCSFVRVKFKPSLASRYLDALKKEIEIYHEFGYCFDTIYIGGGTPTIMPDRLARIIEFVKSTWQIRQISVETNPNHLKPEILRILKDIGTNRLSIGVQSFDNEILENIQRLEKYGTGGEIKEKLSSVVGMFDTVNVDMIFNFPNQTEQMLTADINIIKEVKADQITYYPLIVSNSKKNEITETCGTINYKKEKRLYQLLVEQLADTYSQESIWCFSNKKGLIDEYIANHDEYAGVGLGSWGYVKGTMYSNTFSTQQYIKMIQENKSPIIGSRNFSYLERMRYCFLLKLLSGTVNISDMKKKYANYFWFYFCRELLFLFITRSVTFRGNNIILTPRGRYYCLMLMRTLFSIVGDFREMRASLDAVPLA
ncbi:MAG: coproporphyrinogen III oxidase family protein [Planctomycetota bacterium]|jgi:coproporphyrinogen III oxidase-like Fe-S oxidoreductase